MFGLSVRFEWLVYREEQRIRDALNADYHQALDLFDSDWNQITSCLDILNDTSCALDTCIRSYPNNNEGAQYLYIYGALQSLFMQQNAAATLARLLKQPFQYGPKLTKIRNVRAELLHPEDIRKIKGTSMSGRASLDMPTDLFVWLTSKKPLNDKDGFTETKSLDLFQLIATQDTLLSEKLSLVEVKFIKKSA